LFLLSKWFQKRRFLWENQDGRQAKNRKKGDESQSQPNFAEMILG
jgi:hypothetical protein